MDDFVTSERGNALASTPTGKRGVRGWLLLLCLMLTVFGPLISAWLMSVEYEQFAPHFAGSPGTEIAIFLSIALTTGAVLFGIYAGIGLWTIRPRAVDTAKNALLLGLAVDIVSTALQIAVCPTPSAEGQFFNDVALTVIPSLIFFTLCFAYLNKSLRVEATYPS